MQISNEFVPPYIFKRVRFGSSEAFIIDVKGYKRFTVEGMEGVKKIIESGDSDPILVNILKFIAAKGIFYNHEKSMRSFEDAVIVFAMFDNQEINDVIEELNENKFVLSRDKTTGIFPKNCDLDVIKSRVKVDVSLRDKDIIVFHRGKRFIYREFITWKMLFNIYRYYINDWETPALIGEFKYGYIVKAPYI